MITDDLTPRKIAHPHDRFFRKAMQDPRVAREFLTAHIPQDIQQFIDLNHLSVEPRSYLSHIDDESEVDVLFKTSIRSQLGYIYLLIEHQSTPDPFMAFRLLQYICDIMDYHISIYKESKSLPLIYPLVLYHGKTPYPYSMNINDLIDAPRHLVDKYFLKPPQLIDLGQVNNETLNAQLKEFAWSTTMEYMLKHISDPDMLASLKNDNMAEVLRYLDRCGSRNYTVAILEYILERGQIKDKKAFFNLINTEVATDLGETIMTLSEQLRTEGRIEGKLEGERLGRLEGERLGKLEGKLEIAKQLLAKNMEFNFISEITGLPLRQLEELE